MSALVPSSQFPHVGDGQFPLHCVETHDATPFLALTKEVIKPLMVLGVAPVALGFASSKEVNVVFLVESSKTAYLLTTRLARGKDTQAVEILKHNSDGIFWL